MRIRCKVLLVLTGAFAFFDVNAGYVTYLRVAPPMPQSEINVELLVRRYLKENPSVVVLTMDAGYISVESKVGERFVDSVGKIGMFRDGIPGKHVEYLVKAREIMKSRDPWVAGYERGTLVLYQSDEGVFDCSIYVYCVNGKSPETSTYTHLNHCRRFQEVGPRTYYCAYYPVFLDAYQ